MVELVGSRRSPAIKVILTCGGPRISLNWLRSWDDAGFGPGKYAEHVMSYIMQEVEKRGWAG